MKHLFKKAFSASEVLTTLGIIGVLICHLIGVLQFYVISSNSLLTSFIIASAPYLLKDIPLCIAALYISVFVNKKGILS